MEPSETKVTDSDQKSRSRVLSRVAIGLVVLLLTAVGIVIWDKYNYPIPYAIPIDPYWSDSTNLPKFLNTPRIAVGKFQGSLRRKRHGRISKLELKQLVLSDSKWEMSFLFGERHFVAAILIFHEDGSLTVNRTPEAPAIHNFVGFKKNIFGYKKFERTSNNQITLKARNRTELFDLVLPTGSWKEIFLVNPENELIRIKLIEP